MQPRVKLVGSHINVAPDVPILELNQADTADHRVRKAMERLPRVGNLPEGTLQPESGLQLVLGEGLEPTVTVTMRDDPVAAAPR